MKPAEALIVLFVFTLTTLIGAHFGGTLGAIIGLLSPLALGLILFTVFLVIAFLVNNVGKFEFWVKVYGFGTIAILLTTVLINEKLQTLLFQALILGIVGMCCMYFYKNISSQYKAHKKTYIFSILLLFSCSGLIWNITNSLVTSLVVIPACYVVIWSTAHNALTNNEEEEESNNIPLEQKA